MAALGLDFGVDYMIPYIMHLDNVYGVLSAELLEWPGLLFFACEPSVPPSRILTNKY